MRLHLCLSLVVVGVLLAQGVARAGLIAHYKFDGDATDATGNGNDGTPEGDAMPAGAGSGFDGEAFQFSGQGHVVIPIDINPAVMPELTVTMWVKPNDDIPGAPGLYKTFGHDDGGWDRTFGLDNRSDPGGDGFRYAAFTGGARPGPTPETGTSVTSDWTFVAAVWDDTGNITFHADANNIVEPLNNTPSGHTTAAIGNLRPDNFNEGWQGLIDEVQIYDEALTVGQVESIRLTGAVPEPGSAVLLGLGMIGVGLGVAGWRRLRNT